MPGKIRKQPAGTRVTDFISLGVISKFFPVAKIKDVIDRCDKNDRRRRDLPAHLMVCFVISMALFMESSYREILRCLLEGIQWIKGPEDPVRIAGKSGISQARQRLGVEPLKKLHDETVAPIAVPETRGARYRNWKLISIDGSTMDVADTPENEDHFGRPGASRGESAFPQLRMVSLVENGTRVLFGTQFGPYSTGESALADRVVESLSPGFLCLADRNFFSFALWEKAGRTGADLLWRMKKNAVLPCEKRLPDGSYSSHVYSNAADRKKQRNGLPVRVIEYRLNGIPESEELYRLITTIPDPEKAPAGELAALYHERWEIETAIGELKTQLKGGRVVLRSKKPELVKQEFYGFLLAHFAIRSLMHEAALENEMDPDRLSFLHAVRVVRRKLPMFVAFPLRAMKSLYNLVLNELLQEQVPLIRGRKVPRGVKRKMSNFNLRPRTPLPTQKFDFQACLEILK